MSALKNGRKNILQKPGKVPFTNYDEVFGNNLALPDDLKKELEDKGLVPRFIDGKKLHENGGYHPKGWIPYKRDSQKTDTLDFKFGNDPSGVLRRGSLILAVKTKEEALKHRQFLDERNAQYDTARMQEQKAEELKRYAKSNRFDSNIQQGFDDNEVDGD